MPFRQTTIQQCFAKMQSIPVAPKKCLRKKRKKYLVNGEVRIWIGYWLCKHDLRRSICSECGGSGLCNHGVRKGRCNVCDSCAHGILKKNCRSCGNSCAHGHMPWNCKICSGCKHSKIKTNCNICYGCKHGRVKRKCVQCVPCVHGRIKYKCVQCSDCGHGKLKDHCKICAPEAYLSGLMRNRVYIALKGKSKSLKTMEYVGCTPEFLKQYLESKFIEGMSWANQGGKKGWQIDHRIPCASFDLSLEKNKHECFHYTNLQPLWAEDNLSKNDRLDWVPPEKYNKVD